MPRVGQGGLLARCTPRLLIGGVRQVRMGYTIEDIPIPTADASRRFKDRHECTNKSRSTIRPRPNKLPMHWPWRTQKPANDLGPAQKKPPPIWARPKKTRQRIGPCQKKPANDLALAKKNPPTIWPWPKKTRQRFCDCPTRQMPFNGIFPQKTRQCWMCGLNIISLVGSWKNPPTNAMQNKNPPTMPVMSARHFVGGFLFSIAFVGGFLEKPANDLALGPRIFCWLVFCGDSRPRRNNPPTIWPWPKKTRQRFGPGQNKPATDLALAQQKPANDLAPVKRHPTIGPRPTNNANELARQKQHHRFGPGQQPANDLVPASRAPAIWRRFGPGRQTTANSAKQNPRRFGPWCSIQYIVCNMYT